MSDAKTAWIAESIGVSAAGPISEILTADRTVCIADHVLQRDADHIVRAVNSHDALVKALEPFARFLEIHKTMGGTTPRAGELYCIASQHGEASITVEHLQAAVAALSAASTPATER